MSATVERGGGGLILGGLQTVLALLAAFEGVAEAEVKLRLVVDIVGAEFAGLEDGQELGVPGEHGIGAEIGGGFLGLVLQDGGARGLQRVVVLQGQANGFLDGDSCRRRLRGGLPGWRSRQEPKGVAALPRKRARPAEPGPIQILFS